LKKKIKKRIKKITKSSLWRDLTITIIGVILGLMITNLYEKNQLKQEHKKALEQVLDEVRDNQKVLTEFYEQLHSKFEAFRILDLHMIDGIDDIDDVKVLVHKDSIDLFLKQVEPVFKSDRLESFKKDTLRVGGDFEIYVGSRILGGKLRNSVWNAFSRQPDFLSLTDFNTIADLEQIHALQMELNKQTNEWKDSLFKDLPAGQKEREKFLLDWFLLIANQNNLLAAYNIN